MARLTYGQKAQRVLVFLLALRNSRIATALAKYGFDDAELALGWDFLSRLSRGRLDIAPLADPKLVAELDAFENEWFPVVSAVLQHSHPAAHELVFRNLGQVSGPDVVVGVRTFIERLERLPRPESEGGLGAEGRAALELLARRGLTERVVAPAKSTLETIARIEPARAPERDPEEDARAEREMWSWYLQWSQIARVAVRERRLLKQLGFLRTPTGAVVEPELPAEPEEEEEEEEEPIAV